MEDKWIGDTVNDAKIKWFSGDSYVYLTNYLDLLKEYKKLLKELEDLKRKEE